MTRTIILFTFLITASVQNFYAQLSFSANEEYGQIFDIVFDAEVEGTLYARTVGNHIIKSEDDGDTWSVLYSDPMNQYSILNDLKLFDNNEYISFNVRAEGTAYNKVIVMDKNTGGIVRQYDVPNSHQSDVLIQSYDIYELDLDIVLLHTTYTLNAAYVNEVFYTVDGGNTWNTIYYSPDRNFVGINNVAIFPTNPERLFLMRSVSPNSEMGGLYISQDSGDRWEEKIPGNTYDAIAFNPQNEDDILLGTHYGYGSHQENLYRSLDGGDNWAIVPITYTTMSSDHINAITFHPQNPETIIVLEENEVIISNDNGASWQNQVYTTIDTEAYYYGLTASYNPFVAGDVIISANFYPFRSADGGITFQKFKSKFVNSTGRIDSYIKNGEKHLYYGLRNGFIHRNMETGSEIGYGLRSLNNTLGGTTFPYADTQVPGRIFNSSRYGMNSVVTMSLDHGETFNPIYSSFMFLPIYGMDTSQSNTNIIWFSFGESVFKMDITDPANTIAEEIILPEIDLIYGVVIDSVNSDEVTITIGTTIYKSMDGGATWQAYTEGLETLVDGQDMIISLTANPLNPEQYALASTKGVYISNNKGQTWTRVFEQYVDKVVFSDKTSGHIIAINHYSDGIQFPISATRIVYSSDGGDSWEIISGEALEYLNSNSSTIEFSENSADIYFGTFDMGLVSYSIDLITMGTDTNLYQASEIALFPNPANSQISIQSNQAKLKSVAFYSTSGQTVLQTRSNWEKINISTLKPGIYMVKVETDKGTIFKRFIKL